VKSSRRPAVPSIRAPFSALSFIRTLSFWIACLLPLIIAFVPDERLARPKLLGLELGIFLMTAFIGAAMFFETRSTRIIAAIRFATAPLLFVLVQAFLWNTTPESSLATVELRRVLLVAASFTAFMAAGFSTAWRRRFLWTWALCAGFVALYGMLQRHGGLGAVLVPLFDRPIGTFGNPIFFAAYLLVSLAVAVQCFFEATSSRARFLAAILSVCVLIALLLTKTRAAWIGFGAAALIGISTAAPDRKTKAVSIVVLMLIAAAAAAMYDSIWSRDQSHLAIWRDTVSMWLSKPWAGVGIGTFHIHFPDFAKPDLLAKWPAGAFVVNDAHNEYLQELAEGGVIGFLSWLIVPALFAWVVLTRSDVRRSNIWLMAGVVGVAVQNVFSVDMRFGVSASLMAQLMGLVVGSAFFRDPAPSPVQPGIRRIFLAATWVFVLSVLVLPRLLQPYRAQRSVAATPGFFDQKLLELAQTVRDLEALAQQYPSEASVFEKLGFVYAKQMRNAGGRVDAAMADNAIAAYEKARALDPKRASVTNNLANVQYTLGHVDAAIALWRRTLDQNPHFIDARLNLGKVLYSKGQLKSAAEQFDAVLRDDPGNAEATVYLKKMVE
jgi:O-antigen ligase